MVNGVSMDNVEHAYAVQQLRKSGKNAKIVSSINLVNEPSTVTKYVLQYYLCPTCPTYEGKFIIYHH